MKKKLSKKQRDQRWNATISSIKSKKRTAAYYSRLGKQGAGARWGVRNSKLVGVEAA